MTARIGTFCLGLCLLGACAPARPTLYPWGKYDEALYKYYKNPSERDEFVARLQTIIVEAESNGTKVPPSCYAEYGYMLYEQKQLTEAVKYFEKERDAWPESRGFMTALITNAQRQANAGKAAQQVEETVRLPEGGAK